MKILVDASSIGGVKGGGAIQVADSICRQLNNFPDIKFVVVLNPCMEDTPLAIRHYPNVTTIVYKQEYTLKLWLTGREKYLDRLVDEYKIDRVFVIFGPSLWRSRVPMLSGFASGQITPGDSPFYKMKHPLKFWIYEYTRNFMLRLYYGLGTDYLYSENESVSKTLREMYPRKTVYTVTNYYNQVFDLPEEWIHHQLPAFNGVTMFTAAGPSTNKNLPITIDITKVLMKTRPSFNFRFVLTINKDVFPRLDDDVAKHFVFLGGVAINECPSLYQQCDIVFQPTLLECFTASYPEAMRMERPIVTTDIGFARSLCGDAAEYYSPLDAHAAAESIYKVATNKQYATLLVEKGKKEILKFDNYSQRAEKLINLVKQIG